MIDSQYKGFTSSQDNTINLATNLHNNMGDMVNTTINETSDYNDLIKDAGIIKTENYVNNRDEYSTNFGNLGQEFLNYNYSTYTGTALNNVSYNQVNANLQSYSPTILANTQSFSTLDKSQGAHRQLNNNEVGFLTNDKNIEAFAKIKYKTDNPTSEELQGAKHSLTQEALRGVDKAWSLVLGDTTDIQARDYLKQNSNLFTVKDAQEFKDGTTNGIVSISDLSKTDYGRLLSLYQNNVSYITSTNPEGARLLGYEFAKDVNNKLDNIPNIPQSTMMYLKNNTGSKILGDVLNGIVGIPEGLYNSVVLNTSTYLQSVLPTTTNDRLNELYMQGDAGSKTQANLTTLDVISTMGMATGVGVVGKSLVGKSALTTKVVDDVGLNSGFNYIPSGVDFYVTKNGIIPSTGYRALGESATQRAINGEGIMSSKDTYFTFDNLAGKSSQEIQSILQLDTRNIPSSYAQFNTFPIINDIKIPFEDWGRGEKLEPITTYFGKNNPNGDNFGIGGATQVITNTPIEKYIIKEIK